MNWHWIAALALILQPVNTLQDTITIEHKGETIGQLNRTDMTLPGTVLVNPELFERLQAKIERQVYEAPQNAYIGDHGQVLPDQIGYKLNRLMFAEQFYEHFFENGMQTVDVPLSKLYAKIDAELIAHLRDRLIGSYVTYYNANNRNRSHNIALSAKAINNQVFLPGETFSFNRVVGQRTLEKGYMQAPVIVRGELSEGIGGGICQVSSTLFNAADRAGLVIVKRYSHSRNVPYVLPGRDATVSWDGPDFAFQNQYNQPILIKAFAGGGRVFVSIYSSDVIEYKQRVVPSMAKRLPEEIAIETGGNAE
ncbi:VanW family protein [Paenibacillus sp. NEAU-GSW1]|uniref:VanW family protein n=1 Tax=Paenibacillus sp. NEAU-GSW1 TaxID=2682486 RepID=UPI0012E293FF|nr:VanW family protein [Paenibacillus sp. NEAU-GSW1]MUT68844.1 hypothetical protein [Paenibacillus sp. NEAU-GSW1]